MPKVASVLLQKKTILLTFASFLLHWLYYMFLTTSFFKLNRQAECWSEEINTTLRTALGDKRKELRIAFPRWSNGNQRRQVLLHGGQALQGWLSLLLQQKTITISWSKKGIFKQMSYPGCNGRNTPIIIENLE